MHNKFKLGFFPTPMYELKRFSKNYPGFRIFIKRDDHTGLATGGNKTRKLEYLIGDALKHGADTVITSGAQQSNHCRQTAAASAMAGLECHLLLGGEKPEQPGGNLLLSTLMGANIHFKGENRKGEDTEHLFAELKSKEKKPYIIPYGGSNLIGAMGFAEAASELKMQLDEQRLNMDYIFFASSSGGMQAGLMLGAAMHDLKSTLMPVCNDKEKTNGLSLQEIIRQLLTEGIAQLHLKTPLDLENIPLIKAYDHAGYGVVTHQERSAIKTLASAEGILLDPVYTARAFYGMMDHLEKKLIRPGSNVLFWHTGGIPATFHHAREVLR